LRGGLCRSDIAKMGTKYGLGLGNVADTQDAAYVASFCAAIPVLRRTLPDFEAVLDYELAKQRALQDGLSYDDSAYPGHASLAVSEFVSAVLRLECVSEKKVSMESLLARCTDGDKGLRGLQRSLSPYAKEKRVASVREYLRQHPDPRLLVRLSGGEGGRESAGVTALLTDGGGRRSSDPSSGGGRGGGGGETPAAGGRSGRRRARGAAFPRGGGPAPGAAPSGRRNERRTPRGFDVIRRVPARRNAGHDGRSCSP